MDFGTVLAGDKNCLEVLVSEGISAGLASLSPGMGHSLVLVLTGMDFSLILILTCTDVFRL